NRSPEQPHHRTPDELLPRPAPALELVAQPLVVGLEDVGNIFGVELLRRRREADEIGEQHGDDLALLDHSRSVRRRHGGKKTCPASVVRSIGSQVFAPPPPLGVLSPARARGVLAIAAVVALGIAGFALALALWTAQPSPAASFQGDITAR